MIRAHEPLAAGGPAAVGAGRVGALAAALAIAAALVYAPALENGSAGVDDDARIFQNAQLPADLSWSAVRWAFSAEASRNYVQPLTWISFVADRAAFGPAPLGHHAVNLALHAATAVLLLMLLWRLTGAVWTSAIVAGIFAVHPLGVEAVAWAVERNTLLAAIFGLLALHAHVSYSRAPSGARYALVLAAFAASLASKPWLFGLPVVMFALESWAELPGRGESAGEQRRDVRRRVLELMPLLGIAAAWAVFAKLSMQAGVAAQVIADRPMAMRVAYAPVAVGRYVGKLLLPVDLAVHYPYPADISPWESAVAAALVVGVVAACVALRRAAPSVLVGCVWFLVLIGPTLGIVQAGHWPAIADRFMYLPMVGLVAGLVMALPAAWLRTPFRRGLGAVVAVAALVALAAATRAQLAYWHDPVALLAHSNSVAPGSAVVEYSLGSLRGQQGRFAEAEELLRSAIRHLETSEAHNQLGAVLALTGRPDEALAEYRRAVSLDGRNAEALFNLARGLEARGLKSGARQRYLEFLEVAGPELEPQRAQAMESVARFEAGPGSPASMTALPGSGR